MALRISSTASFSSAKRKAPARMCVVVRAEGSKVNLSIRKNEEKVTDIIKAAELPKPKAVYCRCWRSAKFPYCDGKHLAHNKETGDNVGPLVIDSANPAL